MEGFDEGRLARIRGWMQSHVDARHLGGCAQLTARGGPGELDPDRGRRALAGGPAAAPKAKEAAQDQQAVSQSDRGGDAPKSIDAGSAEVAAREGESIDVQVPTLGESVTEATVSKWFKKVGASGEAEAGS